MKAQFPSLASQSLPSNPTVRASAGRPHSLTPISVVVASHSSPELDTRSPNQTAPPPPPIASTAARSSHVPEHVLAPPRPAPHVTPSSSSPHVAGFLLRPLSSQRQHDRSATTTLTAATPDFGPATPAATISESSRAKLSRRKQNLLPRGQATTRACAHVWLWRQGSPAPFSPHRLALTPAGSPPDNTPAVCAPGGQRRNYGEGSRYQVRTSHPPPCPRVGLNVATNTTPQ